MRAPSWCAKRVPQGAAAALAGIPLWRAASELFLVDSDPDRDATDRKQLADDYYDTVHALIEAAPESASTDWLVVALRFTRTDAQI